MLKWREEPIAKGHDRKLFDIDCGVPQLNHYLQSYARQNHKSGGAKTFVAVSEERDRLLGYYTLSPSSIEFTRVPKTVRRGLGRYEVPVFRLARLAVHLSAQGRGLGGQLLFVAGERCLAVASEVGGVAILIDAKNQRVAAWYEHVGGDAVAGSADGACFTSCVYRPGY